MRYQIEALRLALAQQLRRYSVWMLLAAILLAALAVRGLAAAPEQFSAAVSVGVVLPEEGAEEFWKSLSRRDTRTVTFILTDEDTLRRNVAVSQWDCGLILSPDYEEQLGEADLDEIVTLVTGPGSTVFPLVRETVAAVLAEQVSPVIARRYLLRSGIANETTIAGASARLEEILPEGQRVEIVLETLDGQQMDSLQLAGDGLRQVTLGSLAILVLVWVMYTVIDLSRWTATAQVRRMLAVRSVTELMLPRLLASLLPVYAGGAAGLVIAFGGQGVRGAVVLLPYLAALGAVALLLGSWRGAQATIPVVIPVAAAACFVLCPVFLDISLLMPDLGAFTRWIPVSIYLRACDGDGAAVLTLWGIAAVFGAAAAARSYPAVLPGRKRL